MLVLNAVLALLIGGASALPAFTASPAATITAAPSLDKRIAIDPLDDPIQQRLNRNRLSMVAQAKEYVKTHKGPLPSHTQVRLPPGETGIMLNQKLRRGITPSAPEVTTAPTFYDKRSLSPEKSSERQHSLSTIQEAANLYHHTHIVTPEESSSKKHAMDLFDSSVLAKLRAARPTSYPPLHQAPVHIKRGDATTTSAIADITAAPSLQERGQDVKDWRLDAEEHRLAMLRKFRKDYPNVPGSKLPIFLTKTQRHTPIKFSTPLTKTVHIKRHGEDGASDPPYPFANATAIAPTGTAGTGYAAVATPAPAAMEPAEDIFVGGASSTAVIPTASLTAGSASASSAPAKGVKIEVSEADLASIVDKAADLLPALKPDVENIGSKVADAVKDAPTPTFSVAY